MEEKKAQDFVVGQKHQLREESINNVDTEAHGNNTQEIVSVSTQKEEPIVPDTTVTANIADVANENISIQDNVVDDFWEDDNDNGAFPAALTRMHRQYHHRYVSLNQLLSGANASNQLDNPAGGSAQHRLIQNWEMIHQHNPRFLDLPPSQVRSILSRRVILNIDGIHNVLHNVSPFGREEFMGSRTVHINDAAPNVSDQTRGQLNPAEATVIAPRHVPADLHTSDIFPGAEEDHDNDWYDSIAREAQMLEELEEPGLGGIYSEEHPIRSEVPSEEEEEPDDHCPIAVEDSTDSSLGNVTKRQSLHPSELDPEEAGPSTKRQIRVPPLKDNEVPMFHCGICFETLPMLDVFHGMECHHSFCVGCMARYIESKVRSGELPIPCPSPECRDVDGGSFLHPENCKKSIDYSAFCSWSNELAERAIDPNLRIYCPNKACGIMLERTGTEAPSKAPCPACKHLMCGACGLDWSTDGRGQHHCAGTADAEVWKLAAERQWKQCPSCKILVERTMGCAVMTCRCRFVFCYECGLALMMPLTEEEEGGELELCQCHTLHARGT